MRYYNSVLTTIGNTPMVKLDRLCEGLNCRVFAKAEFFNPTGSVKDRLAGALIDYGENLGLIKKDTLIVEPTSGNTGIGLASICASKGYRLCLTMPDTMSVERQKLLKIFGADIVLTPGAQGMKGAISKAREIVEKTGNAYMPDQFSSPANADIHRKTTGPEIVLATKGKIDAFVAGVGTGGTITGTAQILKKINPKIKIIAVEPANSPVLSGGAPGKHSIQGIGAGFIPPVLDIDIIDEIITVKDEDAKNTSALLAQKEGLLCGVSSGAAAFAAMETAKREDLKSGTIVTVLPDTGERYLSTMA